MKSKKLSRVLIFCLSIMFLFITTDVVIGVLIAIMPFHNESPASSYFAESISRLIGSFVVFLVLKKLGKINILKNKRKGFWNGVLLGSIAIIISLYSAFISMTSTDINWRPPYVILALICMCFTIGFYEEIQYRGVIFGIIDDYFGCKNAKNVWQTVILSGILFGLFHLVNIVMINPLSVFNQIIQAVGVGIFFGAIYMRTRNLYSLMFLHAIYDIFAFNKLFISDISMLELMSRDFNFIATLIYLMIYISASMFLLRKKKMQEIINSEPNKICLNSK